MIEIDGYSDISRIGHGGLGDVYRATRASTGGDVAIKVLRDVSDASVAWHRTRRELTALVSLAGHAHVIQLLELLQLEQGPALVMEYAPGGSVAALLARRDSTLTVGETVLVGRQTAAALVAAHARGIVHRDIKPQNLLIDGYGQVKLCDFGIASLTRSEEFRTRTSSLSMRYASPEDLDHDELGPASDVYSLGATLLHLARGAPPTLKERLAPWVPPPTDDRDLAALDRIIASCLRPSPARRPTAAQLEDDLEHLGWSIDERQRAISIDARGAPAADPLPSARRGAAVVVVGEVDVDPRDPPPASPAGSPPVDAGHDDTTVRRADRPAPTPPPLPRRPPAPRRGRRLAIASLVGSGAVVAAIALWPDDAMGPADPPPDSTVATAGATPVTTRPAADPTRTVEPVVALAARPAGLPDIDGPEVIWPFGPVGECLVQVGGLDELQPVVCDEPHDLQRMAVGELAAEGFGPDDDFDRGRVGAEVGAICRAVFETFVGTDHTSSEFDAPVTRPSAESWSAGDRRYQCLVGVAGARLVGDARGSGR